MRKRTALAAALTIALSGMAQAEGVAVFPVQGVNTDRSFTEAFGMVLASKYAKISKQDAIGPIKAAKAIGEDGDLTEAAKKLGVDEYIEIEAVGLYLSNREKKELMYDSASGSRTVVILREGDSDDDDDDEDGTDQNLLDNSKTIVTATRFDANGSKIYSVEMTLLTYGDIEESGDRIALCLFKKMTPEEARSMTNITRREGMGQNKLFSDKLTGIKFAGFAPVAVDASIAPVVTIGFDMRLDSDKFFVEFGAGGRLPSALDDTSQHKYGGIYFELGGDYYFLNGPIGLYGGIGAVPFINMTNSDGLGIFGDGLEMGIAPYLQFGVMLPRNSRTQFYVDLRVAQNVMPVTTHTTGSEYDYNGSWTNPIKTQNYPTEIGLQLGVAW